MEPTFIALQHVNFMLKSSADWQVAFKWLATGCMITSAVVVSFSVTWAACAISFLGFLFGHILWSSSAFATRDWPLLTLNMGFIPIDIYAMYIRT